MSVGVSLGRLTLRAMPRRSRWSATVRRWTPNSRARSSNERPCWYSAAAAATSEGVSRRWTGFVGRRAALPAVGESTPSTPARSAVEPGFECCPLLSGPPAPGRFADRCGAFCAFRPAAGSARNPWSGDVSRVSGGFESRPQRSTRKNWERGARGRRRRKTAPRPRPRRGSHRKEQGGGKGAHGRLCDSDQGEWGACRVELQCGSEDPILVPVILWFAGSVPPLVERGVTRNRG